MVWQTFEGTWEEIAQQAAAFAGRKIRLTVLDDQPRTGITPAPTLDQLMKDYVGSVSSAQRHNTGRYAEEIFGEIMSDKQKRGTPQVILCDTGPIGDKLAMKIKIVDSNRFGKLGLRV